MAAMKRMSLRRRRLSNQRVLIMIGGGIVGFFFLSFLVLFTLVPPSDSVTSIRRQPPHWRQVASEQERTQQVRRDYDVKYPPNEKRTRARVESLRRPLPQFFPSGYDIYNCPATPPKDYPFAWNVLDVLENWNPANVTFPEKIYQGLCVFDYQRDYDTAVTYQKAEVPFVVINTPELWQTAERWNHDGYLLNLLGNERYKVEHSHNRRLMFWKPSRHAPPDWKPPTNETTLTFSEWLSKKQEYYYFRFNGLWDRQHLFLFDEFPMFSPTKNFFMVNPEQHRGINCRFGMTGIIAETHYDASRNFIVVLKGQRRYILAHPSECLNMELYPPEHPSGRHSSVDWTNITEASQRELFPKARVNEVILQAGDALYLPTQWFHFIVSLTRNYQCNARSGTTFEYEHYIQECGFPTFY